MKKALLSFLFIIVLSLSLTCCKKAESKSGKLKSLPTDRIKTFGDIIELKDKDEQTAAFEDSYVYVFNLDGVFYRASSKLSDKTRQEINDLDFDSDGYKESVKKIIAPLKVEKIENLSDKKLSKKELDALIGKTGQYLFDHDWYCESYDLSSMTFKMNYDPFCYTVVFEGTVSVGSGEFDKNYDIKDLTVKSIVWDSLGNATLIN